MYQLLLLFLLTTCFSNAYAQPLQNSYWKGSGKASYLRFKTTSASHTDFGFIDKYAVSGDTLTFRHSFSDFAEVRKHGQKVKPETYELPDSQFRFRINDDSLVLEPLNASACFIAYRSAYGFRHLEEADFIAWDRTGEKPESLKTLRFPERIAFVNQESLCRPVHVNRLTYNYDCFNMNRKYYCDLEIDSTGRFFLRTAAWRYDSPKNTAEVHFFEGKATKEQLRKIDSLLSCSGQLVRDSLHFRGWASHSRTILLKAETDLGTFVVDGSNAHFPETLQPLLHLFEYGFREKSDETKAESFRHVFTDSPFDNAPDVK